MPQNVTGSSSEAAVIAVALKNLKVHLIMLHMPTSNSVSQKKCQYQILRTLNTSVKPTCLIQLDRRHLAIAVGSLKEESNIEIHDIQTNVVTAVLKHHTDMIDSLLKYEFPIKIVKGRNAHIVWFLSASRDRHITLWKLIDGKVMKKSDYPNVKLADARNNNQAFQNNQRVNSDSQISSSNVRSNA